MLVASAPTRLDFGGGWTDVPPYPEERGGFVCNLAIERRASVSMTSRRHDASPAAGTPAIDPLLAAAFQHARRFDLDGTLHSDFPVGAGLGGSSAVGVAIAAALAELAGDASDPATLAERSRHVEATELGVAGGRQDHYAAAYGGALGLTFDATVAVERIPLTASAVNALESRLTLIYTGESRISADTITAVLEAYTQRRARVVAALDRMAVLARGMRAALHAGDVATLASLVDEHWVHQKSLHPRITTARIDAIEAAARKAGASGFKALGASGGGCVLAISSAADAPRIRTAVHGVGELLAWQVARDGVRVESRPTP